MIFVVRQRGVVYPLDFGVFGKVFGNLFRVLAVALHSQSQRIAAYVGYKAVLRAHNSAEIAHHLRTALCAERHGQIRVNKSVIAFVRLVKGFIAGVVFKMEVAQINYNSAQRRRVPVKVFGLRVNNYVRAELFRAAQYRGRKGVVNRKQHAVFFSDFRNFVKV